MKSTNLVTEALKELAEELSGSLVCIKRLSPQITREIQIY